MSKFAVQCTWDEVPHLTQTAKAELWAEIPAYQRKARSAGIPELGSGVVYTVAQEDVEIRQVKIPADWERVYGMDFGWNNTAVVWAAIDRLSDVIYIYDVYKRGLADPSVHSTAIKERGEWIPGVCDPSGLQSNPKDGSKLLDVYRGLGLNLHIADNTREAGILEVWKRLASKKLRVFSHLGDFWSEYTQYKRDKNGLIVKDHDHLMDAMRYLVMTGLKKATTAPRPQETEVVEYETSAGLSNTGLSWMGS